MMSKVLVEAEDMLCKHLDGRQHAYPVHCQICGAGTVLGPAFFENQNSHLQRNLRKSVSAVAQPTSGASAVWETLELISQLQDKRSHGMTLTGFELQHTFRMPRLRPKKTPASIKAQNSQLQRDGRQHVSAVAYQALGASTIRETLSRNNQAQLQDDMIHGLTLTGFSLYTTSKMPRIGPKPDSQLSSNAAGNSQDASICVGFGLAWIKVSNAKLCVHIK